MRLVFSEEQKKEEKNKIYLEEDDVLLEGEFLEGEGTRFILSGIATIEGERYHDFQIEFELAQPPREETAEAILAEEWEWYDFLC